MRMSSVCFCSDVTQFAIPNAPNKASVLNVLWWTTWHGQDFSVVASTDGVVSFLHLQAPDRVIAPTRVAVRNKGKWGAHTGGLV